MIAEKVPNRKTALEQGYATLIKITCLFHFLVTLKTLISLFRCV